MDLWSYMEWSILFLQTQKRTDVCHRNVTKNTHQTLNACVGVGDVVDECSFFTLHASERLEVFIMKIFIILK